MATRNSSQVERRRSRVRRRRVQARPRKRASSAARDSSRPRASTRAGNARSGKRIKASGRRPGRPTDKPRIPAAIEVAIDAQRTSIGTAISLLYCLHSALRREIEDAGRIESEPVEDAADWADLTEISAMLMVRLNAVHSALDPVQLVRANPDPEMVKLIEAVRGMGTGDDDREGS
jgi:hypothetical protein